MNTRWEPDTAVVFVGTDCDSAGRPSADCCCDYLNFFTDHQSAQAWAETHRHIPGQIVDQTDAEALAAQLFGHLLAE